MPNENWDNFESFIKQSNSDAWYEFKERHFTNGMAIIGKIFIDYNLSDYDFSFIVFERCKFVNCNMSGAFMVGATFTECEFTNGTILSETTFGSGCNPPNIRGFKECSFYHCEMVKMYANQITIEHSSFHECNLTNTNFNNCAFSQNVEFFDSNLSGCNFSESSIHKAGWVNCLIDEMTNFYKVDFISSYPLTTDGSDTIKFGILDKNMNWDKLRFYSSIPIFGIAWVSFVFSILLINFIRYINDTKLIETLNYPVEVPDQAGIIISSSVLLGISATIYKFKCPDTVQNFTQTEWVYEHKHPRPLYLVDLLQSRKLRLLSVILMFLGGLLIL